MIRDAIFAGSANLDVLGEGIPWGRVAKTCAILDARSPQRNRISVAHQLATREAAVTRASEVATTGTIAPRYEPVDERIPEATRFLMGIRGHVDCEKTTDTAAIRMIC